MATEVFIPKLGQTMEYANLIKWLIADGSKVSQGQEILEVETDKAIFAVEAPGKGWLHIGPYKEGDVVPVLEVVAIIGKEDEIFTQQPVSTAAVTEEKTSEQPVAQTATPPATVEAHDVFASPRARKLAAEKNVDMSQVLPTGGDGVRVIERDVVDYLSQVKATPVAQKMAAEVGVDLHAVTGTGPRGKIVKEDVARALQPSAAIAVATSTPLPDVEVLERIPLKGVRGIIAERMGTSVHTTARVTLVIEVDATELVTARTRLKDRVEQTWGFAPGYNDLLAKACAIALRKFPYVNARLAPDAVELLGHVNIGLAVDTERGLMVPVVQDVDKKNLHQFGTEFREMVDRARKGRSLPDDLSGGTFTITNLGMHEIDAFTPVINLPEAAILGVGRIAPKPIARGNDVVIRQMWTLSLVFDHRLVDGAPAARFLQFIKQLIEEPYLMLAE